MLRKDGGMGTPGRTLKLNPCACPGWWYGSWPRISTRVCPGEHNRYALNRSSIGGYTWRVAYSPSTKSLSRSATVRSTYGRIAVRHSTGSRWKRSDAMAATVVSTRPRGLDGTARRTDTGTEKGTRPAPPSTGEEGGTGRVGDERSVSAGRC